MSHWITPAGSYYEGDRAGIADTEVPRRPSLHHAWDGLAWRLDSASYKASVKRKINDAANLRIVSYYPLVNQPSPGTQNNMLARMTELLDKVRTTALTQSEFDERAVLQAAWQWISSVRSAAKAAKLAVDAAANDQASIDTAAVVSWPTTVPPEWPI